MRRARPVGLPAAQRYARIAAADLLYKVMIEPTGVDVGEYPIMSFIGCEYGSNMAGMIRAAAKLKTIAAVLVLAGAVLRPEPAMAFGGGGGAGDGLTVFLRLYPNVDQEAARLTYQWFRSQDDETLRTLAKAGNVCERMECNGLPTQEIRDLANAAFDDKRQDEINRINWIGAGGIVFSTVIALAALLHSIRTERRSRRQKTELNRFGADLRHGGGL